MNTSNIRKIIIRLAISTIYLLPTLASAFQITVPSAPSAGVLLYGLSTGNYTTLNVGGTGTCLTSNGSVPSWGTCGAGGSGGGTWSTTTSTVSGQLINYPNNTTDIVTIGATATTTAKFYFDPNTSLAAIFANMLVTGSTTLQNFTGVNATTTRATTTNMFATRYDGTTATLTGTITGGTLATAGNTFTSILCDAASCNNSQIDLTTSSLIFGVSASTRAVLTSTGLGIGTTSPYQLLSVAGGNIHVGGVVISTSTSASNIFPYASTTAVSVSQSLAVTPLTSAITLTGSDGTFAEYAGTSCTNQFVRSLDALGVATCATVGSGDVSLAALTAGSGLTSPGTYTGAVARTFAIDFTGAYTWTGLQQFSNSTSTLFSANYASTTELRQGGNKVLSTFDKSIFTASTTPDSAYKIFSTATTTIMIWNPGVATGASALYCKTTNGTVTVELGTGSASTTVIASTAGVSGASTLTWAARANVYFAFKDTAASAANSVTCTATYYNN